ncbi:hypothetical protein ABPG77_006340 [Micractinium sp. CCAP 211/92]
MKCLAAAQRALLALLVLAAAAAAGSAGNDAAILHRLRAVLAAVDPAWSASWLGWQPNDTAHPCTWQRVECRQQRVVSIRLYEDRRLHDEVDGPPQHSHSMGQAAGPLVGPAPPPGAWPWGPLIPELAQLDHLRELEMQRFEGQGLSGAIPSEWGRAGAFPRLRKLSLEVLHLQGPLPEVQPGGLPVLESLHLGAKGAAVRLPPSWGASPLALPALHTLSIHTPLEGPLPAEWARGFRMLSLMVISGAAPVGVPAAVPAPTLPPEWAQDSAFPRLVYLGLSYPQLSGSFPSSWEGGGWHSLETL